MKRLHLLGTRGVPAAHGGFETFAEQLAPYLAARGWEVRVYCQQEGEGPVWEDAWQGVRRIHIPVRGDGARSTIVFDWKAARIAARAGGLCLTLGYNTAVFGLLQRLRGQRHVFNMDGIEWSRAKWGPLAKTWFWLNDWAGCWLGHRLIADHPEIARHLATRVNPRKITTIAYGAERIEQADPEPLRALGLEPGRYLTLIARPEPENSILEVVQGFSARPRGVQLVVLGAYGDQAYHRAVQAAAGPEVRFVGAIYDKDKLRSLRAHSLAYVHGHRVGGTNPSLVEALGAGNAVLAQDNRFNRWVAGEGARYFGAAADFDQRLTELLADPAALAGLRAASRARFDAAFQWAQILAQYEAMLLDELSQS